MENIPQNEIDIVTQAFNLRPEYLDTEYVINAYSSYGLKVLADPFTDQVLTPIKVALQEETPLSVIRIGDGEANLLTYGCYPDTRSLNSHVVKALLGMQQDSFVVDELWMIILQDLIMGAITQADIVGVLGLWRKKPITTENLIQGFLRNYRGISGHWRGIDYMLNLAKNKLLANKIIASAHLYFSVIEYLDTILPLARKTFVISNRDNVTRNLQRKYPNLDFDYIPVGNMKNSTVACKNPTFLSFVYESLPQNMHGCLGLVGAGPWAEIYCTWIKKRGGVGVDIGSGFDLLDGLISRPIHKAVVNSWKKKKAWQQRITEGRMQQLCRASEEIRAVIPKGETFIMVDEEQWGASELLPDYRCLPFLEKDGCYWGSPADALTAVRELERMRQQGANFIVFGWPAFWWLDFYQGLQHHLQENYPIVSQNDHIIVFDLTTRAREHEQTAFGKYHHHQQC